MMKLCGRHFGPGIIRKRVRLADIVGCEAIRIQWWYGWGIHLTPYGWLYNVSGFDAVAITLRDGQTSRLVLMILTASSMQSAATPARTSRVVELVRGSGGQRRH